MAMPLRRCCSGMLKSRKWNNNSLPDFRILTRDSFGCPFFILALFPIWVDKLLNGFRDFMRFVTVISHFSMSFFHFQPWISIFPDYISMMPIIGTGIIGIMKFCHWNRLMHAYSRKIINDFRETLSTHMGNRAFILNFSDTPLHLLIIMIYFFQNKKF